MNAPDADGGRARLFVALQYLLPQHVLSRLAHRITRSRVPLVKNALIRGFVDHFHPDMSEAEQPDPLAYETFNAFFTRALRAQARPCDADPAALVSPVDGTVSQIGRLDGSWLVQAKGHAYTLESLLA
ncbi:MAG: phosphatidylserine decarboxylase, partial [Gammaproteobacteria bacterium]